MGIKLKNIDNITIHYAIYEYYRTMDQIEYVSEQQRVCVESNAQYKIIKGVAGSRKTDTLIKSTIMYMHREKRNVLILTLVGSVTNEITDRFSKMLNIQFCKENNTNHYTSVYTIDNTQIHICISNYDAWIDRMLRVHYNETEFIQQYGGFHSYKITYLRDILRTNKYDPVCYLYNRHVAGLLLIDEIQDFSSNKIDLVITLAEKCPTLHVTIAGDYLQTIFECNGMDLHPINAFNKLHPSIYNMNICFRCPKAHIDFNNMILEDVQKKYPVSKIESNNDDIINKPYLFTHNGISENSSARILAEYVRNMIDKLLTADTDIVPGDIAIIMGRTQNNKVYQYLHNFLNILYSDRGFENAVIYMNTSGDGVHTTINWSNSVGKTVLLSIHGDKGRGHKVVFLLGITEHSIPREFQINKPEILIAESLINVGTTRSTKYLFIGFMNKLPSRYLAKYHDKLAEYAYCAWDKNITFPPIYEAVWSAMEDIYNLPAIFDITHKIIAEDEFTNKLGGEKIVLSCTDMSINFEHVSEYINKNIDYQQEIYGIEQRLRSILPQDGYIIMGRIAELLIQRLVNRIELYEPFIRVVQQQNVVYTTNEIILAVMNDVYQRGWEHYKVIKGDTSHRQYFKHKQDIEALLDKYVYKKTLVLHTIFNTDNFRKHLKEFMSDIPNEKMHSICIWNIALCFSQIKHRFIPCVNTWYGLLNDKIDGIHKNVKYFVNTYLINTKLKFEEQFKVTSTLNVNERKILGYTSDDIRTMQIYGVYDIYDKKSHTLYEIKGSHLRELPHSWIIQAYTYAMLMNIKQIQVDNIIIVNIMTGSMYNINVHNDIMLLEDIVETTIGPKFKWHKIEINSLINEIKRMRKFQEDDSDEDKLVDIANII